MSREKIVALLAGVTVAVSMTSLYYSLTQNPQEGFDFHYADLLLPILLFTTFRLGYAKRPQWFIILFSGLVITSTLYSTSPILTLYSATKLSLIFITFSALRSTLPLPYLLPHTITFPIFLIPIILTGLVSIPIALAQAQSQQAFALSGQPNILGGHALVLLLSTSLWLAPFWAVLLATTGTRAPFLGLLAALPFLPHKRLWLYPILTLTLAGLYSISQLSVLSRLPATSTTPSSTDSTILGGRPSLWTDAVKRIKILGSGYDTTTQLKETNPHNIYLQLLQELGLPLGALAISSLLVSIRPRPTPTFPMPKPQPKPITAHSFLLPFPHPILRLHSAINPALIAILTVSFFDHYWLTTGQGMYLFAWALTQPQEKEAIGSQPRRTRSRAERSRRCHSNSPAKVTQL